MFGGMQVDYELCQGVMQVGDWVVYEGEVCVGKFGSGFEIQLVVLFIEGDMVFDFEIEGFWCVLVMYFDVGVFVGIDWY